MNNNSFFKTNSLTVSIIIPVYNVAAYIERCARSLYEQSYQHIEYIWVDDATPDDSIEILERVTAEYLNRKSQVRIVTHAHNKGLPSARNTGLSIAQGDYIFHCDSDDWVDEDMIKTFAQEVSYTNADIVYSDWYLTFSKSERYMKQPEYQDPLQCVKAMLSGTMRFNVWNKFVKRSLYIDNQIFFPAGCGMGEDMTMIKIFSTAVKVTYLQKGFYHYMQVNPDAYTKVFSQEHWRQLHCNVSDIRAYISQRYGGLFLKELHFFCLNVKHPLLITGDYSSYERWLQCFSDSNAFVDFNQQISWRTRWLQHMVLKRRFWLVRAHYYLLIKFVYGVIYRQ